MYPKCFEKKSRTCLNGLKISRQNDVLNTCEVIGVFAGVCVCVCVCVGGGGGAGRFQIFFNGM